MSATTPLMPSLPRPFAVLLHDRANALLETLVALLDLRQRRQPRPPAVRLLAQRLELQLAAAELGAQRRPAAPRLRSRARAPRRPSSRGRRSPSAGAVSSSTSAASRSPAAVSSPVSAREPRRQIVAPLQRARPLRLAPGDAARAESPPATRPPRPAARARLPARARRASCSQRLLVVFALARLRRGVDVGQLARAISSMLAACAAARARSSVGLLRPASARATRSRRLGVVVRWRAACRAAPGSTARTARLSPPPARWSPRLTASRSASAAASLRFQRRRSAHRGSRARPPARRPRTSPRPGARGSAAPTTTGRGPCSSDL